MIVAGHRGTSDNGIEPHHESGFPVKGTLMVPVTSISRSSHVVAPRTAVSPPTAAQTTQTGGCPAPCHVKTGGSGRKYRRVIVNRKRQLELVEEDLPNPRPGEVRVRILAAGVSLPDIMMREGIHPEARRPPFTPGWDVVGVVDAVGEGVGAVPLGATVAAMPIVGGYAESICLPETELVRVPPRLDSAEAVCLLLNYVTAYQMLHRSAQARPGETALVHGAAGGVGTAMLQLTRLQGVPTYGTASTGKLKTVESLGGHAIDYKQSDFLKVVRGLPGGGVDVVFDGIGGWNLLRSWRALTRGGRLVAYGLQSCFVDGKRDLWRMFSSVAGWAAAYTLSLLSWRKKL